MSDSESGTPGAQSPLSRRSVLKGLAGAAGLAVVPGALLEACSSSKKTTAPASSAAAAPSTSAAAAPSSAAAASSSAAVAPASSAAAGGGAATGTITFGSNYSDAVPKAAFASMIAGFTSANPNAKVTINTVDHNTFQNNINNYLQGTPDDLFTWFAGFRMRFFASQGLATPIDDVWDKIGANFSPTPSSPHLRATTGTTTSCRCTTTHGASSTARASSPRRATRSRRRGTPSSRYRSRCKRTASCRWPWARRTRGRRWAPSTSSTCVSTDSSSTWT